MFVSIIICTYRRAAALGALLHCLARQTYRNCEILVVDGSGEDASVRDAVESSIRLVGNQVDLRLIPSEKGLTRQRNVGLRVAQGDLICFLDDDVTVDEDFIAQAVDLFERNGMKDVGGVTGYDVLHYGRPMRLRHRLRMTFGFYPTLRPGALGHCGLVVPLDCQPPFSGCLDVSWLGGFCMVYRREAIKGLYFDEGLSTHGGEDINFSMRVGKDWRLVLCGDLKLKHHITATARQSGSRQVYECSYGIARSQLSRSRNLQAILWLLWYAWMELLLDLLSFLRRPSVLKARVIVNRQRGLIDGALSVSAKPRNSSPEAKLVG